MEAAVLKDYGTTPEFGEFEEPQADGQALIDVSVAGLNPVDHTIASGRFPGRDPRSPRSQGLRGSARSRGAASTSTRRSRPSARWASARWLRRTS